MKQLLLTETLSDLETEAIAEELAAILKPGDIVALYGSLGSGKTCFVRGLARGLHLSRPVKSPSFSLINEYPGETPLFHIDFYRLVNAAEISDLGWTEYLSAGGIVAIEWAEKVKKLLPVDRFDVYLSIHGDTVRGVEVIALGNAGH
jgi:tRNA threonylcarbamoyladenosine biosynthesis protein TsaE